MSLILNNVISMGRSLHFIVSEMNEKPFKGFKKETNVICFTFYFLCEMLTGKLFTIFNCSFIEV